MKVSDILVDVDFLITCFVLMFINMTLNVFCLLFRQYRAAIPFYGSGNLIIAIFLMLHMWEMGINRTDVSL